MLRFKQFTILQEKTAMKVGTDGVLLGAWASVDNAARILDVGTGTGLIALMLAQRNSSAAIDAVEVEQNAYEQATENVQNSPWASRINVIHSDFGAFSQQAQQQYNLIVSNPPYFSSSLLPPDAQRTAARHTTELSHHELLENSLRLLTPHGTLSVILPYVEGNIFIALAANAGLRCCRKTNVATRKGSVTKRLLLEFSREQKKIQENTLYIRDAEKDSFTCQYKELTKEFYLKF
jgi:tRNA1Val (adenine37-N6)-methyltransferase